MKWNERSIASALVRQTFKRNVVALVPNCNWTGSECDLLIVERGLRIIDVEIKISRVDLKADAKKDKWWQRQDSSRNPDTGMWDHPPPILRLWPSRVWKHYYVMPAEIWDDKLLKTLASPASGVLLFEKKPGTEALSMRCARRCQPCPTASRLKPEQVIDIARLANLRMWDAYERLDKHQTTPQPNKHLHGQLSI